MNDQQSSNHQFMPGDPIGSGDFDPGVGGCLI